MTGPGKTTIFVDGDCIVCDLEIAHYKKIAPALFDLVDISAPGFAAEAYRLRPNEVQRDLHVLTPDGELKTGVDAFAHIWGRIDRYAFAARLVLHPVVNPFARLGYRVFTRLRPYLPRR